MSSKVHPTPGGQGEDPMEMPGVVPSSPFAKDSPQPSPPPPPKKGSILKTSGANNLPLADVSKDAQIEDKPAPLSPLKQQLQSAKTMETRDPAELKKQIQASTAVQKLDKGMMLSVTAADVEELFKIFDINTDGTIQPGELKAVFKQNFDDMPQVQSLLEKCLAAADTDNNGEIDPEEFRQCLRLGSEINVKAMAQRMRGLAVKGNDAENWVYRENLVTYLEDKREQQENCRSLPATLMFFVLFFYLVSSHLNLNTLNRIGTAVRGQISETKLFLENGFPNSIKSVLHSRIESDSVAEYNKIIGGIRVSLPYEDGEASAWWFSSPSGPLCPFGKNDFMKKLGTTVGQVSINPKKPDVCDEWAENSTAWMLWPLKEEDSRAFLGGPTGAAEGWPEWASGYVDHLNVDFLMKNHDLEFYTLVHIEVYVEGTGLTRSHHRVESFNSQPVWLNMQKDGEKVETIFVMVFDVLFLLMMIYTAASEIMELMGSLCKNGFKKGFSEYASVWNFIDWLNIGNVVIIVMIYFYANTLVAGTNLIVEEFPVFDGSRHYSMAEFAQLVRGPNAEETCQFSPEACIQAYTTRLSHLLHQSERTLWGYWELKWFIALFAISSALRFFKAFRANPRLNVVTKTLIDSAGDLAHFMIVFCALLMAFVLVGHLLFGGRLVGFSTPAKSLNTCFLFLLCFEFDGLSAQMFEHGKSLGLIWAWLFNLVMMVLLLNMILAIIFDVYTEVKTGAGSAPSLIQQTKEMWEARREFKQKQKEFKEESKVRSRRSMKQSFVGDGTGAVIETGTPNFEGEWRSREGDIVASIEGDELSWPSRDEPVQATIEFDEITFRHWTGKKHKGHVKGDKLIWTDGDIWIRSNGDETAEEAKLKAKANVNTFATAVLVTQATGKFKDAPKKTKEEKQKQKRLAAIQTKTSIWTEDDLLEALKYEEVHESEVVHPGSLAEALDASELQAEELNEIIQRAREHSEAEAAAQEISLTDSIRLIGRIDTNMRSILRNELAKEQKKDEKPFQVLNNRMKGVETALGGLAHRIDKLLVPR